MYRRNTCTDCGNECGTQRCRRCQCRHTYRNTHPKENTMHANTNPTMGDIGEEQEEIELEPIEVPTTVPAEPVPA